MVMTPAHRPPASVEVWRRSFASRSLSLGMHGSRSRPGSEAWPRSCASCAVGLTAAPAVLTCPRARSCVCRSLRGGFRCFRDLAQAASQPG